MTTFSPLCNVKIGNATYYANASDKKLIEYGFFSYFFLSLIGIASISGGFKILVEEEHLLFLGIVILIVGFSMMVIGITTMSRYYRTVQRVKKQNKDCRLS